MKRKLSKTCNVEFQEICGRFVGCVVKSAMTLQKLALAVLPEDDPLGAEICWSNKSTDKV